MEKNKNRNSFPLSDYFSFDIEPYTTLVHFESGDAMIRAGEQPDCLYYLIEGRAKLSITHPNGRVSLISFMDAPCFIGEMELLGAQEDANEITAITPCTCYAIEVRWCKEQILNDNRFLRHLCLFLSRKAIGNTEHYSKNQAYTLEVRLAQFILLASFNGVYRERHTEVSEFLGVTYRHLLYVLADFVKRGILVKTPQGYRIEDLKALQKVAEH